ncbi:uncharacterized protein RJT21DRAFT_131657 [Scheffersomyces amazonensis]|uniref:uncharacterized protein n=1 Tax=Scheffersomyces amazonensis TaxID=1078765 RepID=UPI00315D849F
MLDEHSPKQYPCSNQGLGYDKRKPQISQDPSKYYPTLNAIRNKFNGSVIRIGDFRSKFEGYDFNIHDKKLFDTNKFIVEGRIESVRKSGKSLYFIDVVQDDIQLQFMVNKNMMGISSNEEFDNLHGDFKKGDYVLGYGYASITNVGELTLKLCKPLEMLTPCLTNIPNRLEDKGIINSNRVLNYLVNPKSSKLPILIKSWIMQSIRQFLLNRQFIEVQTPILSGFGTGANAEPFVTEVNALSGELAQLRVAPELWLKKLIISGFPKIFEIGNNFRNEGIDSTHNPEFTSCEFYQTFINLEDLIKITEDMIKYIYNDLNSKCDLRKDLRPLIEREEYPKFEFITTLESKTGIKLPNELTSDNLIDYFKQIGLSIPLNKAPANLLDILSSRYLESISMEEQYKNVPIFVYNQPAVLSPLAKSGFIKYDDRQYDISHRFEMFINGKEYVNAYEEENSPFEQESKFRLQETAKAQYMDNEMLIPDWKYIESMQLGLPPTGGWGCGIDRLSMLFSGVERIDEVLPFGNLRDVKRQ